MTPSIEVNKYVLIQKEQRINVPSEPNLDINVSSKKKIPSYKRGNDTKWVLCKGHQDTKGVSLPLISVQLGAHFLLRKEKDEKRKERREMGHAWWLCSQPGLLLTFWPLEHLWALFTKCQHHSFPQVFVTTKISSHIPSSWWGIERVAKFLDMWSLTEFSSSRDFTKHDSFFKYM